MELKSLWETKLKASKTIDTPSPPQPQPNPQSQSVPQQVRGVFQLNKGHSFKILENVLGFMPKPPLKTRQIKVSIANILLFRPLNFFCFRVPAQAKVNSF
jgi:hypothetical protein